jgi:hypothetical protein
MGHLSKTSCRCPRCGFFSTCVETRRSNTQYVDDERNWVTTCEKCFEIEEEMWDEYYSGCL